MRYIKLNFKYLIKNILFIFLLSLIPAIFMGSLLSPFKFLEFINNYANLVVLGFGDIFNAIIDISPLKILFYIIGFALLGVCVSVIIGFIENHFRSGKRNYINVKNYVNNNILTVLINLLIIVIINFIVTFLCGTIIFLFHIMFAGLKSAPNAGCIIIALIMFTLYLLVISVVSMVLFLNIPNMIINGYTFKQTLSNTINFISKDFMNLLLAQLTPFIAIIPLISIFNFSSIALHIINCICLIISIMYYTSFVMTAYFDLNNIMRYDNRKYYSIK